MGLVGEGRQNNVNIQLKTNFNDELSIPEEWGELSVLKLGSQRMESIILITFFSASLRQEWDIVSTDSKSW